jgi:hypothetical protein
MQNFTIYCDGHVLGTIVGERNPVEALREYFKRQGYLADEYCARADRLGFGRVAEVRISHYTYRAEAV